jgi:tRNA uridine 5-carboxymethylaminomethyl modification enzyme
MQTYDIAVIGAGHAGIEAALAAARLGAKTAVFTITLDNIGNMPCNPSVGGTAKGHLVCEIDALGGEMGKAADACFIQSRMLNRSKGPAVHSLRVQADRRLYHSYMKQVLEKEPNLSVIQGEVVEIVTTGGAAPAGNSREKISEVENAVAINTVAEIVGIKTRTGTVYGAKCVIIATGTYLRGKIHIGRENYSAGPDNVLAADLLSESLRRAGASLRRFKTGTPARIHKRSIDFSKLERQEGDSDITPFSSSTKREGLKNKVSCYIAYTNAETHRIIRENIGQSAMFSGNIEGTGPRYCPSIEDKITRFADKERHQIFVEPMGLTTDEYYLQGLSTSLPTDVQELLIRSMKGLENAEIMRPAYAIEYDCIDPTELTHALEHKNIGGLFGAGQFCGTSGYEEAAAQGIIAGINAARKVKGLPPFTLTRDSSYIGTLIDDLVIKGTSDPYRMMTSRSEFRLLLRQDNADERLTPAGYEIGLVSREIYDHFREKEAAIASEIERLEGTTIAPSAKLNALLVSRGTSEIKTGVKLADLIRRPQIKYTDLAEFDKLRPTLPREVFEEAEIRIEYAGYIKIQREAAERLLRLEGKKIPIGFDFSSVRGISLEAREKLLKIRPETIGAASRISGVSPADIQVLLLTL